MEGTNIDEAAVACPVCTLYLREGISLQRHLDTHPKEQVIEALIKASAGAGAGASASASASTAQGQQTQTQTQTPLSPVSLISTTSVQQPSHNTSHLAHNSQVSPQSPYPIGPVFECPPIGTVMPPQFASFSYQQFVNNGTVMIPQYAMAPQANQMMQMLYNPYSIYQQQQIPTVQMLSPVNTLPNTNRLRTVPTLANDTTPRPSITIPVNNNEPKEILPEILSEVEPEPEQEPNQQPDTHTGPESERMVTELDAVRIPPSLNHSDIIQQDHNGLGTQGVRRDHHQSPPIPPSIPITCNISNISNIIENDDADGGDEEDEDDDDEDDVDDDDDDEDDDDKAETVLPNIHNAQPTNPSIQLPSSICNISCRDVSTVQQQQQDLQEEYIHTTYKECVGENVSNEITLTVSEDKAKECRRINDRLTYNKDVQMADSIISPKRQSPSALSKESCQPVEVEQLEHLLITIMERELGSTTEEEAGKEERGEKRNEGTRQKALKDEADAVVKEGMCLEDGGGNNEIARETISPDVKLPLNTAMRLTVNDLDKNYYSTYRYKHSLSAPSSPISPKKAYHSYSTHSEFGSAENLNIYPVGFDASVLQDEDEEDEDEDEDEEEEEEEEEDEDADEEIDEENDSEANENDEEKERLDLEENLDEADMEIEEIPSPHTPAAKSGESCDYVRSHTPLSTSSGISVLRVRKDLSKSCSPMSVHSFPHMETTGTNQEESSNNPDKLGTCFKTPINCLQLNEEANNLCQEVSLVEEEVDNKSVSQHINSTYHQPIITDNLNSFPTVSSVQQEVALSHDSYSAMASNKAQNSMSLPDSFEAAIAIETTESKSYHYSKPIVQKQSLELLNLNEDAHAGPMNVFEFDGLQILVPSTYINESSQKAVSATSQQSMASSEGAVGIDEEVKSINMRADETMPPRGELSEQESNGYTEQSAWQLYMGQESSRMSTSYDLMARESWEESEGSDNEIGGPLLDSRSLATHFTSSLFLDRDRKSPTKRTFKCYHCSEVFDCPKERRVHSTTVHKEAGPSSSGRQSNQGDQVEVKDIKLLDGRVNIFEDIFVPGLHVQQIYHHQQPLLHQLQPAQTPELNKLDSEGKADSAVVQLSVEVTCTICSQRFSSDKSLQLHHRRVHVAEASKRIRESAKCQICNEEFPSVLLFNAHLKVHPLECSQCGKYFYRKQNFKLHMKRHLGIKPFPCTVCDKAFLTKQKLDEHTNGHTGNAPVKCNLCNETFRRYSNLTQHKNRHHLNIKKKLKDYICHCGEVFHTKKKLAWHKETHDEKPKACTYCNERFIHMASLTRHMRRAHNRRFVPDAHRESENVECPICKCIYLRSSLAVHMRVHNGERPYECQVCSKAFSTKWNLQLHKWTHAARSTKPFKCNQCSAAFYRHSDYTAHMNSHRNVRPYTCNYCGAQFIRKYNCLRHVKEHEENKAYTCDVCNKTFHRSYYLKEHLRVHSGARPYTCHICGKSSGTKSNHNKHVRIHHAREPVNTEN